MVEQLSCKDKRGIMGVERVPLSFQFGVADVLGWEGFRK